MTAPEEPTPVEGLGWQVLDPDGNVIASGPITELEMAGLAGDAPEGAE